jgi:lipoprotein LpqH
VKRGFVAALGGVAIVVGGLAGCSSDKSVDESVSSATESAKTAVSEATESAKSAVNSATESAKVATGSGPKLTIDGQDQNIEGNVTCAAMGGNIQIALGNATGGLGAQISEGDAPVVHQVGLGNVGGVALGFQEGAPGGTATATKEGNTYKISGTATGVDLANPTQPVTKPFELEVTCP